MSHPAQVNFCQHVKQLFPNHFDQVRVVDIGSLDINGNNRGLFTNADYTGVDIVPGKNVDVVQQAHKFLSSFESHYHVVISTEMLEHDKHWQDSLAAMYRALKPGGLLLLTCAGEGRLEHGTHTHSPSDSPGTLDYYQNVTNEMLASVLPPGQFKEYYLNQLPGAFDLQFYGIKS